MGWTTKYVTLIFQKLSVENDEMMIKQWMEWGLFGEFYFQAKPDITFYVSCHGGSNINIYVYIYIYCYMCIYIYIYISASPLSQNMQKWNSAGKFTYNDLGICSHSMLNLFLIIWSLPSKPLRISTIRHMVNRILSIVFLTSTVF